jgi:predicted AlkP superfamily pyrophosphatase or phosphodiesterase
VDHLERGPARYHVSDWRQTDADKIDTACRVLDERDPEIVVLYLTEVDAVQHRVGTTDAEFDAAVRRAGEGIETFLSAAADRGEWGVTVFSDHGMTDVTGSHDLLARLRVSGLERGRDFDAFLDSTVARFWNVRDKTALRRGLESVAWGRILSPDTLRDWRVEFPDHDYGDIFFLADPGVLIVPSDMGSTPLAAMHGYDPADPTSDACLLSDVELPLAEDHITQVLPALLGRIREGR